MAPAFVGVPRTPRREEKKTNFLNLSLSLSPSSSLRLSVSPSSSSFLSSFLSFLSFSISLYLSLFFRPSRRGWRGEERKGGQKRRIDLIIFFVIIIILGVVGEHERERGGNDAGWTKKKRLMINRIQTRDGEIRSEEKKNKVGKKKGEQDRIGSETETATG